MKILKLQGKTELTVKHIKGFLRREVVVSGTSAKVNCPKEYLGHEAYLVILENGIKKRGKASQRRKQTVKGINKKANKKN